MMNVKERSRFNNEPERQRIEPTLMIRGHARSHCTKVFPGTIALAIRTTFEVSPVAAPFSRAGQDLSVVQSWEAEELRCEPVLTETRAPVYRHSPEVPKGLGEDDEGRERNGKKRLKGLHYLSILE